MQACIGLGANLGDAAAAVQSALQALDALPKTRLLRASRLYRTPAWGKTDQPAFVNAAAVLETKLDARALLDHMLEIERDFGRKPGKRWGPRVLDLDLVAWDGPRVTSRELTIPHPLLAQRDFVLMPLSAVAPAWRMIGGLTPRHLASRLGKRRRAS